MNAVFEVAHELLEVKEGVGKAGYSDLARDRGGETVNGIARKRWPDEPIWKEVDRLKALPGFPETLGKSEAITTLTLAFYRKNFWEALGLDFCSSQAIADELYEQAVNMGDGPAGRHLQEALNFLNTKEVAGSLMKLWPELKLDGAPGQVTHMALDACTQAGRLNPLYDWMNVLQGEYLAQFIRNHPDQRPFAAGLVRRVETITHF